MKCKPIMGKHNIANYERGRCDIPTGVLAELDQLGFNVSWELSGRRKMLCDRDQIGQ